MLWGYLEQDLGCGSDNSDQRTTARRRNGPTTLTETAWRVRKPVPPPAQTVGLAVNASPELSLGQ